MLVLIGPSASGKTEVAKMLISMHKMEKLITYTTRAMRFGERDGVDYHFVSVAGFNALKDKNEFIETTYYNGNYYGSRKKDVAMNKVVVLDPSGLAQYNKILGDEIISVFLKTPAELRINRMRIRGDSEDNIKKRITSDAVVFQKENITKANCIIENNNNISLETLADFIYNYYISECQKKCK